MTDYTSHFSRGARTLRESAIRRASDLRDPNLISLAPGFPDPSLFAWNEMREISASILTGSDPSVLQYGATRGYRPLVEALSAICLDRGIHATPDEVIVTTGSQQALDLSARVFVDAGDVVLVELPAYTGAIAAFANAGARLVGVRQDREGIDLVDLDARLAAERGAGRRVAFLYVVPNFQNPTGLLMSLDRRLRLLEWAARRDLLIVEDDPYGALYFDDVASAADTRPIKADDAEGRVVYMSSFSKTVAPGLRVAWISAARSIVDKLEIAKQSMDLCSGSLDQRVVHEVWKRGALAERLPLLRRRYQSKRTAMERALGKELGELVSWPQPKGGFFLWVAFPKAIDTDALLSRALARGVVYVPGRAFFVDHQDEHYARLAFSGLPIEDIEAGISRLADVVREELNATGSPASREATRSPAAPESRESLAPSLSTPTRSSTA